MPLQSHVYRKCHFCLSCSPEPTQRCVHRAVLGGEPSTLPKRVMSLGTRAGKTSAGAFLGVSAFSAGIGSDTLRVRALLMPPTPLIDLEH